MAEQAAPVDKKQPGKARRIATKLAQVAGESLYLRSPILGQAFEMTQMFKRPEAGEDGKQTSRLGNALSLIRQSAVQNSTLFRKFEMFMDNFDTFREDEQKENQEQKKEKTETKKEGDGVKKGATEVSGGPSITEYLDNKENPYYVMMQSSNKHLERIVELLAEQRALLNRSLQIEMEDNERQRSLADLGAVGREPDALTQIRTPMTMPPSITEGLGTDQPQQQEEGGWFGELVDDVFDLLKKNKTIVGGVAASLLALRKRLGSGLSSLWSGMRNLGGRLTRGAAPAGVTAPARRPPVVTRPVASTGPATAPRAPLVSPAARVPAPALGPAAAAVPRGAPPVGPAIRPMSPTTTAPVRIPGVGGALTGAIPGAILEILLNPTATGTDPQEDFSAYIYQRLEESGVGALPEIQDLLNSEAGMYFRETFPRPEYETLATDSEAAREFARETFNSPYNTRKPRSNEVYYGDTNALINRMVREYTTDAEGAALSPDVIRQKLSRDAERISSSPAAERAQSTIGWISRPQVPLSFGNAGSAAPMIVNNQGGPTSVNNGGNITNIITGGSSLTLPQLAFNLPSVLN